MTIVEAITLLLMVAKAFPELIPVIKNVIESIKAEVAGKELTDEQKAEISALFDKTDSELEKACSERLEIGNLEQA